MPVELPETVLLFTVRVPVLAIPPPELFRALPGVPTKVSLPETVL